MIPEYYNDSYKSGYYVEKLRLVNGYTSLIIKVSDCLLVNSQIREIQRGKGLRRHMDEGVVPFPAFASLLVLDK